MRIPTLALAMPLLLLAGCGSGSQEGDGADPGSPMGAHDGHDGNVAGSHLLAPTWEVGDYWTISSPQAGTITHVVSGETSQDWIVDTDNRDIAFFDAVTDISLLGEIRKSDLAGSQGDQRVEFLRFPLQSNMTWTTTWDGAPTMVHVGKVEAGKADVVAMRADGSTYATYTYSDKSGYFTHFAFYDPTGETVGYEWSLTGSGSDFGGQLVRWTLVDLFSSSGAIPSGQSSTFSVEPGFTDVYVTATLDCVSGAVLIAAGPATGPAEDRGYSAEGPCPLQDDAAYPVTAPTQQEQWGSIINAVPTTVGTLELHLYGRIQVQFMAGNAPG